MHLSYLGPGSFFLLHSKSPQGAAQVQLQWLKAWWPQYPLFNDMMCMRAKSFQSCLTVCDPVDCTPPASSVPGILQTRMLEWVAMPSSRGSSRPRDQTLVSCLLHWQAGSLPIGPPGNMAGTFFVHTQQPRLGPRTTILTQPWRLRGYSRPFGVMGVFSQPPGVVHRRW
ncbi:unnamed protein product [Rangifer tarandus platyrhynchus]|uniref:Uncharacterized protein n=2 Tax=Rangifer tarandus platyrhynchus TaxID=3082113 RepID=A0ABN8ZWP1_RANTA|nr:unnamed protein product [Rangifer tarandus platyrhynchus]